MSGLITFFSEGVRILLFAIFALAVIEKSQTLATRAAAWHPVILGTSMLRRHAALAMTSALTADLAVIVFLVLWPQLAAWGSLLLILTYSIAGLRAPGLHRGDGCRCFWGVLDSRSLPAFVLRNSLLALCALVLLTKTPPQLWKGGVSALIGFSAIWVATVIADQLNGPRRNQKRITRGLVGRESNEEAISVREGRVA